MIPFPSGSHRSAHWGFSCSFIHHLMSDNIPDGISLEALEALKANAVEEATAPESKGDGPFAGLTKGQLVDLSDEICAEAMQRCGDPMLHKLMLFQICTQMVKWHTTMGNDNDLPEETRTAWMRDAGKFQSMMCILSTISLGDDDFTCVE